jgi:hypothetical protein
MRRLSVTGLAVLAALLAGAPAGRADENDEVAARQKATAEENWQKLDLKKPPGTAETAHIILFGELPEARAKVLADSLEKQYGLAGKALKFNDKEARPWPGKLTVYVFSDRATFNSFVRNVDKGSPRGETAMVAVGGDTPHVAAGPPAGADPRPTRPPSGDVFSRTLLGLNPSAELQAGYLVSEALLSKKAGAGAEIPEYLRAGFSRATAYRAAFPPASLPVRRGNATWAALVGGRLAATIWSVELPPQEQLLFGSHLMDFLAYGPGMSKFPDFVTAFRVEVGRTKTLKEALESAKITELDLEKGWLKWR